MKLVVVVPAYKAARHLPALIGRIVAARPPALARTQTVIVDDGSQDDTARVAQELASSTQGIEVVVRPRNGGYGAAMKTGLEAARALGADRVASVHADGQYSPEALPGLLAALDGRGLDLLQGSRIAGGQTRKGGMPLYKVAGNWLLGKLERRVLGLSMTDFHSGYLVYGRRALAEIPFAQLSDSFDFDLEVIASARARGLAVGEAPIPTHYGDEISHLNPLTYGLRVLRVLWRFQRGSYGV
jgi:glycosyltransferase involved in cell wall biosynthesis